MNISYAKRLERLINSKIKWSTEDQSQSLYPSQKFRLANLNGYEEL